MIKAVLFDLDGTLIEMDQDAFLKSYFQRLTAYFAAEGYDPAAFSQALMYAVKVMLANDGAMKNDELFWKAIASKLGQRVLDDYPKFEAFYEQAFDALKPLCGTREGASDVLSYLRARKIPLVLASQPAFPFIAYEKRMGWGGITVEPFEWITTYDESRFCKPCGGYYLDIATRLGLRPEECLMVGNDVSDDMSARHVGMQVFLLTDYLLNPKNEDYTALPHGNVSDLLAFLEQAL